MMVFRVPTRLAAIVLSSILLLANVAYAHPLRESITNIDFNTRSGFVEVSHRYYLHDAEHVVKTLLENPVDFLKSTSAQRAFGHYAVKKFSLISRGVPFQLRYLGEEIEGKFIWIYQEFPIPNKIHSLEIHHESLQKHWNTYTATVNIRRAAQQVSVVFSAGDAPKEINFD